MLKGNFTGERALFGLRNETVTDSVFYDGESPLKESSGIEIINCTFKWKYPIWYSENISVSGGRLTETARAGIWYTESIALSDTLIDAPKTFRRSKNISLSNVTLENAEETLWDCEAVSAVRVTAKGDYFGMNLKGGFFSDFTLTGNYPFDGAENIVIKNARLLSKDAFWNAKNVTVEDSVVTGEYLAWNSENVTFKNCVIESHQALCYAKGLKVEDCVFKNTDLAFEYSFVNAVIKGKIDSVKNPSGGDIYADEIGEIITEADKVDVSKTLIRTGKR